MLHKYNMDKLYFQNKYSTWYFNIVNDPNKALRSKKDAYYELHHILPSALGGLDRKENLVLLTPREHFVCHMLLPKMAIDPINKGKMVYAFFRMKDKHKNSRLFERFKKTYSLMTKGQNNPFYGKTHSNEVREKIFGKNHHMYGKKHSEESCRKMSESKKGKYTGDKNGMFGKKHPPEWREQHSKRLSGENHFNFGKPAFTKGRVWINDSVISKMATVEDAAILITQGWVKGRLPK
jgi:hypothetical protein